MRQKRGQSDTSSISLALRAHGPCWKFALAHNFSYFINLNSSRSSSFRLKS